MEAMYRGKYINGKIELEPRKFYNFSEAQPVVVIPVKTKKLHAAGILHAFANSSLVESEDGYYEDEVVKKYS